MERKYVPILLTLIVTLVFVAFFIVMGIGHYLNPGESMWLPEMPDYFIPFIPGTIFTDLLIILVAPIVGFLVIFYLFAPYWTKLLIKIHKLLSKLGGDPKYGVVKMGKKATGRMLFFRAMVLSFFTFSLAVFLVELLVYIVQDPTVFLLYYDPATPTFSMIVQVFVACLFLGIFTTLIFAPVWLLEDSGLTSYQVSSKEENERSPVDIQGVHAPLAGFLTGYAGLATVFSWITFIILVFDEISGMDEGFIMVIIFFLLPLIIAGLFSIPIYIYEKKLPSMVSRLESHWNYEHMKPPQFEKEP